MTTLGTNVIVGGGGYTDAEAIAAVEGEATLNLAGDVDVATGKILSSDGLKFPDTQVASADVNALDDYEEGTFTVGLADDTLNGSSESQTYDAQEGWYTKTGNRVQFQFALNISSLGTLTTTEAARIVGLPFVANSAANSQASIVVGFASSMVITGGEVVTGIIGTNTSILDLYLWDATTGNTVMLISEYSLGGNVRVSGQYFV